MKPSLMGYRRSLIAKLTGAQRRIDVHKRRDKNYKAEYDKLITLHALQAIDDYLYQGTKDEITSA